MRNVMTKAWEIAREGQRKFGGKVSEYIAEALRMAWAIVKKGMEKIQLKGTEKQVKWANDIRENVIAKMEEVIEEITERANEKRGRAKAFEQYVNTFEEMKNNDSAVFWIERFGYGKTHFEIVSNFKNYLQQQGEEYAYQKIFFDLNAAEKLHLENK